MGDTAIRVLVSVSSKSCHWQTACKSPEEIVQLTIDAIQKNNWLSLKTTTTTTPPLKPMLLVTEKWIPRVFIVFDLFNDDYDPDTAHLPGRNDLPVLPIYFSKKEGQESMDLGPQSHLISDKVNKSVYTVFDSTGLGSRPPFIVDHLNGNIPTYPNPRSAHQC